MKYTVLKIEEDLDFGCEERGEDNPVKAVVTLRDENDEEKIVKAVDEYLYEANINEGDIVLFDVDGHLKKVLSDDWTRNCNKKTVNIPAFVNKMENIKSGKKVAWICPFCGGQVSLLEQNDGQTVIGCQLCDMRIHLESK